MNPIFKIMVTGLPDPPEGQMWCAMCVALYKGTLVREPANQDRMKERAADQTSDKMLVIAPAKGQHFPPLAVAVTMCPLALIDAPLAPACWTHAVALDPDAPLMAPGRTSGGIIPGFN